MSTVDKLWFEDQLGQFNLAVLDRFRPDGSLGFLNHLDPTGEVTNSFAGGQYVLVRPKEGVDGSMIHRRYGGKSGRGGSFFTLEPRDNNLSARIDLALPKDWNAMNKELNLWVPQEFIYFVGIVGSQTLDHGAFGGMHGGALQVYVPKVILPYIVEAQTSDKTEQKEAILKGREAQRVALVEYNEKTNRYQKVNVDGKMMTVVQDPRDKSGVCPRCGQKH